MNVNPFSYLMNKISQKVSKSGDTMSGRLLINRPSSSTAVSWSELEMGNDTAEGTVGNSAGRLVLLGKGTKYTILDAPNSTANRTIDLPDKSGTVALTSDITALFSRFSFSGTPDSDGDIITDVPISTHIPIQAYNVSRNGWTFSFTINNLKSTTYWYIRVNGNSSGTYSGYILAKII